MTLESSALAHDIQAPYMSGTNPICAEQDQGNEEVSGLSDKLLQDVPSSPGSVTHAEMDRDEGITITTPDISDSNPECAEQDMASSSGCATHVGVDKVEETIITTPDISDPGPEYAEQDQGNKEIPGSAGQLSQDVSCSPDPVTHVGVGEDKETVMTTPDFSDPKAECAMQDRGNKETRGPADQLLRGKMDPVQTCGQSLMERDSASLSTDEDLWTLGDQLLGHFERFGDLGDLQRAILVFETCFRSISVRDYRYIGRLRNLGVALSYRFRQLGELGDIKQAIATFGNVVNLTPDGHPDKPDCLSNLGDLFLDRFERLGKLDDIEQAISRQKNAVNLTLDGHPHKPGHLNRLGNSYFRRFQRLEELHDLEQAISRHTDAVDLTPDGHPDKPNRLNNLGTSFLTRFQRLGELSDLEQAILRHRNAANITPDYHPEKPSHLNNLGASFLTRFQRLQELSDIEQAISSYRDAVDLTPDGHPDKPGRVNNLGNSFLSRFERLGEPSDLDQAISRHRDAVNLTPNDHPHKPSCLINLGHSFLSRFQHLGVLSDLEQAILRYGDALELTPDGHPERPECLNSLGGSLNSRFECLGKLGDLEQAISTFGNAIDLIPDGHPNKPSCLTNLGNSFLRRFQLLGELSDLNQAIPRHRDAVNLTPDGHPNKPGCLNNLGSSFVTRFGCRGELSDLEQAISSYRDAVNLTPDGHPDKPSRVNNLGASFLTRFQRLGELSDLEEAISRQRDAVDLIPDHHPHKPTYLNNLGNSFRSRFEHLGVLSDLNQAITRHRHAVDLTPDDHPNMPVSLYNLAKSFFTAFRHLGESSDLQHAISRFRNAVDLTPDGHPHKSSYLIGLAYSVLSRFSCLEQLSDVEQAISFYSHAACAITGPITTRFHASQHWILCARALPHHSLLHAYSIAIGLLPQVAWIGLPLAHRYRELMQADVAREAAAAALDSGLPETAVEWLEQGRSIVWGELFQLRSSYAELSSVHPDHARRLRQLSTALEHSSATHEKSLSSLSEQTQSAKHNGTMSLEQEADRHLTLAIERDRLLQDIRKLPGFERFLLHKEFSQLRASAHSGPVVILNAAESRCDALVILADVEHVIHVPLPNFTLARSAGLQNALKILLGHARAIPCGDREGGPDQRKGVSWASVLSILWKSIVKPILDALAFSTPGELSRIFWCPTGPFAFFPIHAAGLYGLQSSEPGHKVFDFVVSSYIPTLSSLIPSPGSDIASGGDLCLLTIGQPPSDGLSQLPGVDIELKYIRAVIQSSLSARTTLLESSIGTVEEVLALMKEADWVHFACHGIQDGTNPTDSGLCLADRRRLKLSDIIALSRPRGGLAFLSACQTAMGDENLSDEAIHIAAGMLFAGYGGVIGTMWSISDRLAPQVAMDVYEQLFQNSRRPDYREAARALHNTVGRLRDNNASFDEWLPFIHVGL